MTAPWANAVQLADSLNALNLLGVDFRPITFKPLFGSLQGKYVQGVQIHITDFDAARISEIQFHVIEMMHKLYPEHKLFSEETKKRNNMFDKVCGTDFIRTEFSKNYKTSDILPYWRAEEDDFKEKSSKYYLY
jgi:uncharacterized protein YbbC (DUF1343 family)